MNNFVSALHSHLMRRLPEFDLSGDDPEEPARYLAVLLQISTALKTLLMPEKSGWHSSDFTSLLATLTYDDNGLRDVPDGELDGVLRKLATVDSEHSFYLQVAAERAAAAAYLQEEMSEYA